MSNAKLIEHLRKPAKTCGAGGHCRCVNFIGQLEREGQQAAEALEKADKEIERLKQKLAKLEGQVKRLGGA